MIQAKIIKDSINEYGNRLTTLEICVHRFVWSEFMTHRVFSRNAASSRAIPVAKMLKQVWTNPAMPVKWAQNQSGMQAGGDLTGIRLSIVKFLWRLAGKVACIFAYLMIKCNLHKQWANRILEPWQWMTAIVSSTDFDNFFGLRISPLAQPEICELAICIKEAIDNSIPQFLLRGQWHLPYITENELRTYTDIEILKKISAARCARVSYLNQDKTSPILEKDIELCERLVQSDPIHASPFEHQATPKVGWFGNFTGWKQNRQFIEQERKI
ncbi:MAG: hypothetical protein WC679_01700 [Bacteroidales bacterium]|jgi:hypothetical protein